VLARLEEETTDVAKWPQEYPSIDFSDEYVVRLLIKQTWQAVCKSKRKRARQLASSAEQQAETKVCPIVSVTWSRLTLCVSHPNAAEKQPALSSRSTTTVLELVESLEQVLE
jgi:hypothetical protein